MNSLHEEILRQPQRQVWERLQQEADMLRTEGLYLAGGTALALQIGHRESVDFDFFSQKENAASLRTWLERTFADVVIRDADDQTVHAEIGGMKVSLIMQYRYPLIRPPVEAHAISMANITDIALMKMLAITHRATLRDYIDLAVILRDSLSLQELVDASTEKYGVEFNVMLSLRAMTHFEDLDEEMPVLLDASLAASWQNILREAVRTVMDRL